MLKFKKVVERGNGTANLNEDQKKYEQKVVELEKACRKFDSEFKKILDTPEKWKKKFNDCFNDQMKKNKLTSRTSRVLHGMSKNLSKLKGEFDPKKIKYYVEAFKFTPEKVNKNTGYIKRSAIDDGYVVSYFNTSIESIFEEKIKSKKEKADKMAGPLKDIGKALENAKSILKDLNEQIEDLTKQIDETRRQKGDCENLEKLVVHLTESRKPLIATIEELEAELGNAKKEPSKLNVKAMVKLLEAGRKTLNKNIENADKAMNEVENNKGVKEYQEGRGALTIRSEKDFQKVEGRKDGIRKVTIGNGIEKIIDNAFSGCANLETVMIDTGCTKIGQSAFSGCKKLKVINTLGIKSIGESAFSNCSSLENIYLGSVTNIGKGAFSGCAELTGTKNDILDTKELMHIDVGAFSGCKQLKGINLKKVKVIGNDAFKDCTGLKKVILPKQNAENIKHTIIAQSGKKLNKSNANDGLLTKGFNMFKSKTQRVIGVGDYIDFVVSKD